MVQDAASFIPGKSRPVFLYIKATLRCLRGIGLLPPFMKGFHYGGRGPFVALAVFGPTESRFLQLGSLRLGKDFRPSALALYNSLWALFTVY